MAAAKQVLESINVPRIGPYPQAVSAGGFVFVAGQPGIDPATNRPAGAEFGAQARQAFVNLQAVLEDCGSSLAKAVKITCFIADANAFDELNALYVEFFGIDGPVRSTPVVALPRGLLISVEAIAVA